jgi:nucleotide-binding universal stress UspA family protein
MTIESRDDRTIPTGSIVVGVDGSADAARAVSWAAREADLQRRPIVLLHAINTSWSLVDTWRSDGIADTFDLRHLAEEAAGATVDAAAQGVRLTHPDLEVVAMVVETDARQALIEASNTAHLLLVGSRGRGPVRSLLLGSVSVAVAQLAACPVVICRPRLGELTAHGIIVGADGSPASAPVLDFAFRTASLHLAPLTVTHCYWDAADAGAPRRRDASAGPQDLQRLLAEAVAGYAETYPDVELRLELSTGLVDQVLAASASESDLLVVGRPHRSALGRMVHASIAAAVVEHAAGTVAVVPEATSEELDRHSQRRAAAAGALHEPT